MSRRRGPTLLGLALGFAVGFVIDLRIGAHDRVSTLPLQVDERLQIKSGQIVMEPNSCLRLMPRVCDGQEESCRREISAQSSLAKEVSKGKHRIHFDAALVSTSSSRDHRCALRVGEGRRITFAWQGVRFTMIDSAMVELVDAEQSSQFRVLRGRVRVTALEPESGAALNLPALVSYLGQFEVLPGADFIVHVRGGSDASELTADSLQSVALFNESEKSVAMKLKGWSQSQELPPWTEVVIRRPGSRSAQALVEIPVPLQWDEFIERRARFHFGPRERFATDLQQAALGRMRAAEWVGQVHRMAADRKVASIRAEQAKDREAQRQSKVQSAEVKRIFRERYERQQLGD